MMEKWDIYDENRQRTGKIIQRGEAMHQGEYHLVAHVILLNEQNEMLIQRRALEKEGFPGMWDVSVGGSAVVNETSQQAAARELQEELGIWMNFEGMRPQLTINFDYGFDDIYVVRCNLALEDITMQKEEVMDVKWAASHEIFAMMQRNEFVSYPAGLIQLYFDLNA